MNQRKRIYRIQYLLFTILFLPFQARAVSAYQPERHELAPDEPIVCSWSQLKTDEYRLCQKRKEFFEKMSPKEKQDYNERVEKQILEDRLERLERNYHGHQNSIK